MSDNPSVKLSMLDTTEAIANIKVESYPAVVAVQQDELVVTDQFNATVNLGRLPGIVENQVIDGDITASGNVIITEQNGTIREFESLRFDTVENHTLQGSGLRSTTVDSGVGNDYMFPNPIPTTSSTNARVVFADGTVLTCSAIWSNTYAVGRLTNRGVSNLADGVVFQGYSQPRPEFRWVRYVFTERRRVAGVILRNLRTDFVIGAGYIRTSNDGVTWETAVNYSLPAVGSGARTFMFSQIKPVRYVELRVTAEYGQAAALGRFDILVATDRKVTLVHQPLLFDINKLNVREESDAFYLSVKDTAGGSTLDSLPKLVNQYSKFMCELDSGWANPVADYPRVLPLNRVVINNLNLQRYRRGFILPKGTYSATLQTALQGGGSVGAYLQDLRTGYPIHTKVGTYNSTTLTITEGHDHSFMFSVAEDTPFALTLSPSASTGSMSTAVLDAKVIVAALELWKVSDDVVAPFVTKRTFKPAAAGPEADWTLLRGVVGTGTTPHNQRNGEGLFSLPYGGTLNQLMDFRIAAAHVVLKVNHDFKLWKYPVANTLATSFRLRLEKIDGPLQDYTQYSYTTLASAEWVPFTDVLPPGTYRLSYADGIRTDYQWYVEKCDPGTGKVLRVGDRTQMIQPMYVNENDIQKLTVSSDFRSDYGRYTATYYEVGTAVTDSWFSSQAAINSVTPQWWAIEFKKEAKTINGYELQHRYANAPDSPRSWQLQGRDSDADEWITFHAVDNDPRNANLIVRTFMLDVEVTYRQFRILVTATNRASGDYIGLAGLRLFYQL